LRGGQRRKCRDSIERRGVCHTQGGLALGHLKHERGRASLGPKRGGDLCGIGGRIEGRPLRKGLWNGICARPDLRGACGKAAAPALGLGSTGRQTGAGQIRWGSTPDGRRCAAVVAACRPTSRPLALVPYRNARVIIQVGAGASPSSKLQPVNNSAAIFRLPYWYGNGTRIAPPRIARSCRATTGVRLSGGDDASEIKRILQMQTPVKSLL
jgi:hypothetical protein